MNRLTKINLPTALQVIAVLLIFLFGYPGCSFGRELKEKTIKNVSLVPSSGAKLTSK